MVRLTNEKIIIEIPTNTAGEDLNNIQQSILMGIQFMNPQMNPMDADPNPVFWLTRLLENTLPSVKDYNKVYNNSKE